MEPLSGCRNLNGGSLISNFAGLPDVRSAISTFKRSLKSYSMEDDKRRFCLASSTDFERELSQQCSNEC